MKILGILILLFFNLDFAFSSPPPCTDWQFLVRTHPVSSYVKSDGTPVIAHLKGDYCKVKWPKADFWGPILKNNNPGEWEFKNEKFKNWSAKEKESVLKVLATMPEWLELSVNGIHRAIKSETSSNPATTNVLNNSIVLYDLFFSNKNKKAILGHELGHILYNGFSVADIEKFSEFSGWSFEVIDGKVFEAPPAKLLRPDSARSKSEDFANYIELYLVNSTKLKKINSKIYDFLKMRFPL